MRRRSAVDRLYSRLTRRELFADGWGDRDLLPSLRQSFLTLTPPAPAALALEPARRRAGLVLREATFPSPARATLPPEAQEARALLVTAADALPARTFVVLAASGDEAWEARLGVVAPLVREGFGALLLAQPMYGARRPAGQHRASLRTVSDLLTMAEAAVAEARALLGWLAREGVQQRGVAGFSMGGQMAAYAAARTPGPLAVAILAAGDSPAPIYARDLISDGVDWPKLGGAPAAREALHAELHTLSLLGLPPPARPDAAVIVGAAQDAFIDPASVQRLHAHWPGSRLSWIAAGHVGAWLFHREALRQAVRQSFAAL